MSSGSSKYDEKKEDAYVAAVMEKQSRRILSHEQCERMSLDELEQCEFDGYQMPQKYKMRVSEYREAYNIRDQQQVQDDYKIGVIQGQIERFNSNVVSQDHDQNRQFSEQDMKAIQKAFLQSKKQNQEKPNEESQVPPKSKIPIHSPNSFYSNAPNTVQDQKAVSKNSTGNDLVDTTVFNYKKIYNGDSQVENTLLESNQNEKETVSEPSKKESD